MDIISYLLIAGLILLSVCSIVSRVLSGKKKSAEEKTEDSSEKL